MLQVDTDIIPNPSFEEYTCIPSEPWNGPPVFDYPFCVEDWISDVNTDFIITNYIREDGFLPANQLPVLPFPDGNGCIGLMDMSLSDFDLKGKLGVCLDNPLEKDIEYTLSFYIGFLDSIKILSPIFVSTIANLGIYASDDCENMTLSIGVSIRLE